MAIGVGMMHIPLTDLYRMTLREFLAAYQGWTRLREQDERCSWERARWLAAVTISPHLKQSKSPQELFPLPWDKEQTSSPSELVGGSIDTHREYLAMQYQQLIDERNVK